MPEGPFLYPPDEESDQSLELRLAELIREQVLLRTREELPHAVEVEIDEIEEREDGLLVVRARVWVETESQKGILVGAGGRMVRAVGTAARKEIEARARPSRPPGAAGARAEGLAPRRGPAGPPGYRVIERIHRFFRHAEEGVCDEVVKTAHGTALLTPSLPLVWQVNAIRVEDPDASAEELAAEADGVQAAFGHRKLVVHDERVGARLAPAFERRGLERLPGADHAAAPAARPAARARRGRRGEPRGGRGRAGRLQARAAVRLAGRGRAPARRDGRPLRPRAARPRLRRPAGRPGVRLPAVHPRRPGPGRRGGHRARAPPPRVRARGGGSRPPTRPRRPAASTCSWSPTRPTGRSTSTGASASTRSAPRTSS